MLKINIKVMKYLHKFNNKADFETAYNGNDYYEPWVSLYPITILSVDAYTGSEDFGKVTTNYVSIGTLPYNNDGMMEYYDVWYCEEADKSPEQWEVAPRVYLATTQGTQVQVGDKIIYVPQVEGNEIVNMNTDQLNSASEILSISQTSNVDYNKKLPVYDLIIDCSGGDAGNGLKITYINPSFGSYEEVETQTEPSFYGYMMDNISSIILKQTLSVQFLNSEGGPTEIVVPFDETDGTSYYNGCVSGNEGNTSIFLDHNNSSFDEGGVLRIMHNNAG